jgi:hypothetical protein
MKRRLTISPALVISLIALFVALGGTTYAAATSLPANSVGTTQLKNWAVTSPKIANGAVTAVKINATGLTVPNATSAGNASSLGGTPAASFLQAKSTLPSGDTETGVWAAAGGSSTSGYAVTGFRFYPPLGSSLDAAHVVFTVGTTTNCPGVGLAAKGYLCAYGQNDFNVSSPLITDGYTTGASRYGAALFLTITGGSSYAQGNWAVTAP